MFLNPLKSFNKKTNTHTFGFTMVELMVCVGILGIMVAVAVPGILGNLPKYRLKWAIRTLTCDFHAVRMDAVSKNLEYRVRFKPDLEAYWIEKGNLSCDSFLWVPDREMRILGDPLSNYYQKGVDIDTVSRDPVYFKPNGQVTGTTLSLKNSHGHAMTLSVSNSGRITVKQ